VTRTPIGMPSRILNCAIDFRARRTCARWPAMIVSSSRAASICLASVLPSPTPMLSVIFETVGACMIEDSPSSSRNWARSSSLYCCLRRGT
jgi:hypothetical protein